MGEFSEKAHNDSVYGLAPASGSTRWILPLMDRKLTAASFALYQPSLTRAKILKELTIFLSRIGLAKLIFRDRVYFERNDGEVRKIFGRDDLEYAIFTGTAGCHRKVTVQVMDGKGTILGYIKVADSEAIEELLDNEAEILGDLLRFEIKGGLFPKVIYRGDLKGTKVLILDTLKSTTSTFSSRLSEKHIMFLSELFLKSSKILKFSESPFSAGIVSRLAALDSLDHRWRERFTRALDSISRRLGETEIPFGLCHRDFTPWNTFFHDGQLYVFDWEYARRDYPPLLDIFHFLIQDGIIVKKMGPERLVRRISENKRLIETYCNSIDIAKDLVQPLLLCYLLDISLLYIERENGDIGGVIRKSVETWGQMMDLILRIA